MEFQHKNTAGSTITASAKQRWLEAQSVGLMTSNSYVGNSQSLDNTYSVIKDRSHIQNYPPNNLQKFKGCKLNQSCSVGVSNF